ncbi:hypothetical protein Btru_030497 [Bulinus truncatus]|nr:hypothetical protein Btru_030497 [Bulinus truncatus]
MNNSPTCYLHFSFVFHLIAFSALLIGYATPNWTLVKLSTGDEVAKGLVVTCYNNGCVMLYISQVRSTFVIVFGMCTASVLISVFLLQVSALAVCNMSCRTRNMGTGLSYFSFFIALLNGATLALYHLDLSLEQTPEFRVEIIGWSQYCIITSAFVYLMGAFLNIADYTRRNRAIHDESRTMNTKMGASELSAQSTVDSHRNLTHRHSRDKEIQLVGDARSTCVNDNTDTLKKAIKKVNAAIKIAAPTSHSKMSYSDARGKRPTKKVFIVSPPAVPGVCRVNNVVSDDVSHCDEVQSGSSQGVDKSRRCQLVKTSNIDSRDLSSSMPAVESETVLEHLSGSRLLSAASTMEDLKKSGKVERYSHPQHGVESKDQETLNYGVYPEASCGHCARRSSAVEEALLTVSHFLDNAGDAAHQNTGGASVAMELSAQTGRQHRDNNRAEGNNPVKPAVSRFVGAVRRCSQQYVEGGPRQNLWSGEQLNRLNLLTSTKDKKKKKIWD